MFSREEVALVEPLRILFVGDLTPYLTTRARLDAFRRLGHSVESIDMRDALSSDYAFIQRLNHWSLLTPQLFAFNRTLLDTARRRDIQVIWIEKGTFVFPRVAKALKAIPGAILVYHNTDDWKAKTSTFHHLHWRFLLRTLDLYDAHITSNLHNVREFRERGLPHVHHMELCANEAIVHPGELSQAERAEYGGAIGFIGHHEPTTERSLARIVEAGMPLKIYGGGWHRASANSVLRYALQHRLVMGDDYAKAITSFDINIGIVSVLNRNHTASRTFQIPALGAFMLHQRNEVVTGYFREDEEMAFFGSDDELVEKCRYYLEHPEERRRIGEAGRRRCIESGYFETDRLKEIIPLLQQHVRAARGQHSRHSA
jgi:hypothetical protein